MTDIAEVLRRLHIEIDHETDGELWALCPGHLNITGEEQGHATWSINEESGVHSCFSCGYSGNLIMLVADVLNFETKWGTPAYERAKTWLERLLDVDLENLRERAERLDNYVALPKTVPISEARLQVFSDEFPEEELQRRRVSPENLARFGVKWDTAHDAWILPIREPGTAVLKGWQVKAPDWTRNHPVGVKKGRTLFGLDIIRDDTVILVESPLDAVYLTEFGLNAVASYGAKVTKHQIELLRVQQSVILALDNDDAGRVATYGKPGRRGLRDVLADAGVNVKVVQWTEDDPKDFGDMEDEDRVLTLLNTALSPSMESMQRLAERMLL